jgi:glycosyltransferase involved in cell wall biosynthesis
MTLKVLQIIRGLDIGGDSGGAELFGIKLARELNRNKDSEVLICAFFSVGTEAEKEWLTKLNSEGILTFFVSEWGGKNNLHKFLKGLINLTKKITREKIDICHSHFQIGTLAAVILKFFGFTKTAYRTVHIRKEWHRGKWTWFLYPVFIRRIFPNYLNTEIGVSKAVCNYLVDRLPNKANSSKIHLIYNGIDINKIKGESKNPISDIDTAKKRPNEFLIGCVGRLAEQKGYPYIFHAMPKLIHQIPNCTLQIAGDGELKTELIDMVDNLGINKNVRFLGLRDDVPSLMEQWDLFVLPSLWEGLPTVVMEAMICGVPVIATDIPGTDELVINKHTGLLVPIKNPNYLADAILELYRNPNFANQMVKHASELVEKFSMHNIANQYYQLFRSHLSRNNV